jgi:hypothetical protein
MVMPEPTDDPMKFVGLVTPAPGPPAMTGQRDIDAQDRELTEVYGIDDEPTDDDLTELRRLHEAATPRPWRAHDTWLDHGAHTAVVFRGDQNTPAGTPVRVAWLPTFEDGEGWGTERNCWNDADLIVAMRNALPGLLAEVERLRAAAPASEDVRALFDAVAETVEQIAPSSGTDPTPVTQEDAAALILWTYQVLRDEFSTTPNKQGEGWDGNDNRSRTCAGDGSVLQGTEGAGLQRGSRRDADGAGLRDRPPQAAPQGLTTPPCASSPVEAGDSHGRAEAAGSPPPTPDPRPWSPLVERFRSALMREHADDWDMETVSEAAHICAHVMALIAQPDREPLWRGKTIRVPRADDRRSSIGARLDVPPGTAVRVDEDTTDG